MTKEAVLRFENYLKDSFNDGLCIRELRLSEEEINYIKSAYPRAGIRKMPAQNYADGKGWYEVRL